MTESHSFIAGIVAKLVYSVILVGLSGVLLRELWTVWFDPTIYIGRFDVISEAGKDDAASTSFPRRIVSAQALLAQQFNDYQRRRSAEAPSDGTYILPGMTPLLLPPEALAGVDITVQNVNLRQLLTAVRRGFLAPNEVIGNVASRSGSVLAAVEWPRAPRLHSAELSTFLVPSQPNEQSAAAYIACSVSWARAVSADPGVALYPRLQFCDFGAALNDLYALNEKASSPAGLDAGESALVRKRAAQLRTHYSADTVFPELYRLRADLLDLLPEGERKPAELVEAQEDRLRYAMLSPKLRDLSDEEKRLAALALARPAIPIEGGKVSGAPENWGNLLSRHEADIRSAASCTGLITKSDGTPVGTGFIVAPGVMMTASFVLEAAGYTLKSDQRGQARPTAARARPGARLCLGSSKASCEPALAIGDVLYVGDADGSSVALASLVDHDVALNPPLLLADPLPAANTLVGQYAMVIGYPFRDPRMPPLFTDRLLGKDDGRKRLMPGRILSFGVGPDPAPVLESAKPGPPVFTTDISTAGGTGGGPFIALTTGRVLGMSYAGLWKGERGKFAYAHSIPKDALEIIGRRLRGEPDKPQGALPTGAHSTTGPAPAK